jgi:hypothetical protein
MNLLGRVLRPMSGAPSYNSYGECIPEGFRSLPALTRKASGSGIRQNFGGSSRNSGEIRYGTKPEHKPGCEARPTIINNPWRVCLRLNE